MPRPKRTLAEVDTNAEPATVAKKALTGRGKAKGKENEVPVTKKAPVAKAAAKKSTASKAMKAPSKKAKDNKTKSKNEVLVTDKIPVPIAATMIQNALRAKAASEKAKDNWTDSPVPQSAPTVEVADIGEMADAESAKAVAAAAKSNDKANDGIALPKSKKSIQPSNTKKTATSSKALSKAKSVAKDEDGKVSRRASGKTWICICRPASEIAKEQDLDSDDEDTVDTCGGGKKCLCFKAADDHPEHKWIVTKKGFELMQEWMDQADKRCPDLFDMYIFNDFYGYGISEVIENMFLTFDKEKGKNTQDPVAMWSIMESMALFLRNCDLTPWHMIDDSEGNTKRIMLIGTALLTTIDFLDHYAYFTNTSSKIRNLGLILSLFLQFAEDEGEMCSCNEDGWKAVVVEKADECGVTIQGLVGIDELVQDIRDNAYDSDSDEEESVILDPDDLMEKMSDCYRSGEHSYADRGEMRSWKQYDWDIELEAYRDTQAIKVWANGPDYDVDDIGGKYYDLTAKRNKGAHMKKYKLGGGGSGWF